jgi:hypothetical protein
LIDSYMPENSSKTRGFASSSAYPLAFEIRILSGWAYRK